jgi:hypothetical protein
LRFIDPKLITGCKPTDWDVNSTKWLARVTTAVDKSTEMKKISNPWSQFKENFITIFGDKCWYTESPRIGTTNDVDHFRPKNAVKNQKGQLVSRKNAAGKEDYASYWWLAYEPSNYRYSCIFSNRPNGDGGKHDYFPLEDETSRAWTPTCNYAAEDNTFLDPCKESDVQLIAFDQTMGFAEPRFSEDQDAKAFRRFELSKKHYNLNEKTIVGARTELLKELEKDLNILEITWTLNDATKQALAQAISEAKTGIINKCARTSKFSAAAVSIVRTKLAEPWLKDLLEYLDLSP